MEVFLRLKHWHVFMLGFGLLPIAFIFVSILDDFVDSDLLLRILLFTQTLCIASANFWLYAVGTYLHKKRYYNSLALLLFRLGIYFSTFFNITRYVIFPAIDYFDGAYNQLGLTLAFVCSVYCSYLAARLLNSVEKQKDVSFGDIFGDIFAFLLYPIGIWWLQPRINRIYKSDEDLVPDPDAPLDQSVR